jgi:hypothetical protein
MKACGQFAGKYPVIHRQSLAAQVVAFDSRLAARCHAQGLSPAKPLKSQAKMAFSTEGAALYYYHQS